MAFVIADRVKETTTTTGTGTYALGGAATGFRTFVAGVGDGNTCPYAVTDGTDWESGIGTVADATPDTLARTTVLASSNAGAAVDWGAGTKDVFCTVVAARTLPVDLSGAAEGDFLRRESGLWVPRTTAEVLDALYPGLRQHPDFPPATADDADDEFGDATDQSGPVNGLDAKWSWQNQQSTAATFVNDCLTLVRPANAGSANHVILKQSLASPTGNWTYRLKMSAWPFASGFHHWGLNLRESATGKAVTVGMDWSNASTENRLMVRSFTGDTGGSTSLAGIILGRILYGGWRYFQVRKSSTTLYYEFSFDGIVFHILHSQAENVSFTTRPDQVGLHIDINGHSNPLSVTYEFFRRVA